MNASRTWSNEELDAVTARVMAADPAPDHLGVEAEVVEQIVDRDAEQPQPPERTPLAEGDEVSSVLSSTYGDPSPRKVVSPARPGKVDGLEPGTVRRHLERLCTRDPGHEVGTPPRLAKAWAKVQEAAQAAQEAVQRIAEVDRERQAGQAAYLEEVREAARTGKGSPTEPEQRDWEAIRQARAAHARGKLQAADEARRAYDALASELLGGEERLRLVASDLLTAHGATLEALAHAEAHLEAAGRAWDATTSLSASHGLERQPGQLLDVTGASAALRQARACLARLDTSSPVLADTRATRCDMQMRQALAGSSKPGERYSIWRLERAEDFKVSTLTRDWGFMAKVPGAPNYETDASATRY